MARLLTLAPPLRRPKSSREPLDEGTDDVVCIQVVVLGLRGRPALGKSPTKRADSMTQWKLISVVFRVEREGGGSCTPTTDSR